MRMIPTDSSPRPTFWVLLFSLFLLTQIPAMAEFLSIDNVNLAFALDQFNPRAHQPQPPGYPLFVLFARSINFFFNDAEKTFTLIAVVVSGLCLPLAFSIGERMFSAWVGVAGAMLLLVNPPFWFSSLEGPIRPHLAFFSLLTAYFAWRSWHGEKSFVLWGAIALGVGSGFRPDLGAFLFPLWLLSAWMGTRSFAAVIKGLAVITVIVAAWLGGMAYAVGGLDELYRLNVSYVVEYPNSPSVAPGVSSSAWLRQFSRLVVWNGLALVAALWVLPIFVRARDRLGLLSTQSVFMVSWLLPGWLFQSVVHVGDPGHTLFSIPAVCILAAYVIYIGCQKMPDLREVVLGSAVVFGTMCFLGFFALPAAGEPAGGWRSLRNVFVFATHETSLGQLRYMDTTARLTMNELRQFTPADRPVVIVSSDVGRVNWFMNWRIARYYAPSQDFWILSDIDVPHRVSYARRNELRQNIEGLSVPVPQGGRIIWLLERDGAFHRALQQAQPELSGGAYLSYTDVPSDGQPFRVMDFEFVPGATH